MCVAQNIILHIPNMLDSGIQGTSKPLYASVRLGYLLSPAIEVHAQKNRQVLLIQNCILAAILNFSTFPNWDSWGLLLCFSGLFSVWILKKSACYEFVPPYSVLSGRRCINVIQMSCAYWGRHQNVTHCCASHALRAQIVCLGL